MIEYLKKKKTKALIGQIILRDVAPKNLNKNKSGVLIFLRNR